MAVTITHPFVSAIQDEGVTGEVGPDEWNATHSIAGLGTGVETFLGTPSSANLAAALTDETGSGAAVFATSPTLVTPILGTPTSGTLTNCTGLPVSAGISGLGTGVATFLATPSSANLISAVTDETGSGALVFGTSPSLTTSALLSSGFVFNWASSDYTITHSTGLLTTSGPVALGGGANGADPAARLTLGSYHDNSGAVSISHIALYGTTYGFGISTGTLAYISASGGVHRFFTGADLTSTNWAVEAGPYNTASTTTATGALRVQGGIGATGAIHAGANSGATPQIVSYGRMLIKGNSGDASAVLELTNNAGNTSYIYSNSTGQLQFTPYASATIFSGDFYAGGLFNIGTHLQRQVPVTETGTTHTVAVTTSYLICNNSGTVTVTLPAAGSFPGRELYIKNIDGTATVISASSNVVPRIGGSAGTSILAVGDGAWVLLVSDLTNWIVVAGS